jgi:uncharacterized protein YmfQ (DUF2313 family)
MPTQEQFYEAIHRYLPTSGFPVWPEASEDAVVNTLIEHIAANTKAVDDAATAEFDDVFPDETTGYLDDWERVLELPKSLASVEFFIAGTNVAGDPLGTSTITQPLPANDQERLDIIGVMLKRNPLNNAAFYEELADVFGYTVTITTGVTRLEWLIDVTAGDLAKLDIFTTMVNFYKPAHTRVTITS